MPYKNKTDKNKHDEEYRKKNLEMYSKKARRFREKHPERAKIYTEAGNKVKLNKSCDICGETHKLQRHHWRYDKPLLVNTLCKTCHDIQHIKHFETSRFGGI